MKLPLAALAVMMMTGCVFAQQTNPSVITKQPSLASMQQGGTLTGMSTKPPVRPNMVFHNHKVYACRTKHFTRGCVPLTATAELGTPYTPPQTPAIDSTTTLSASNVSPMPEQIAMWSQQADENGQHVYKLTTQSDLVCTLMTNNAYAPKMFSITCVKYVPPSETGGKK